MDRRGVVPPRLRPNPAIEVAGKNRDTLIVAYTHGQPAQPSTFGHYLGALVEMLLRLNREGRTIIMVTHETSVARLAKRQIYMKDGVIAGEGLFPG